MYGCHSVSAFIRRDDIKAFWGSGFISGGIIEREGIHIWYLIFSFLIPLFGASHFRASLECDSTRVIRTNLHMKPLSRPPSATATRCKVICNRECKTFTLFAFVMCHLFPWRERTAVSIPSVCTWLVCTFTETQTRMLPGAPHAVVENCAKGVVVMYVSLVHPSPTILASSFRPDYLQL
ncbi:hypothetical protein POVWA2_001030 [Plasmodium ovale wallikeri]|uniref:Uncharacterized protein n=1 Tax=Plasmodium ovale wallikeri TaxID=864142 RepID=A0A1A8YH28_PLAOA|nr:hypothetical protein POVWA1_000760 [Plasmodium ovale wallikeri]SBT30854.1 hypothetical protein POVWA2_001030 [Plasmodium ovale wallikeri]